MRPYSGMVLTAVIIALPFAAWVLAQQASHHDPHGDPETGALRVSTEPRGSCRQCHTLHADSWGEGEFPYGLFTENTNRLAFWDQGDLPCHGSRPPYYPLDENDRISEPEPDAGYFEANVGGTRRAGLEYRGRWPGERAYTNTTVTATGRFLSPHAQDADMPRRDASGEGLCLNCHNPHGTPNPRDLLIAPYGGIGGHNAIGAPVEYRLCFSCHGKDGPAGMDLENRNIEDYYDAGLNGEHAGHQIRKNPDIALSWPAYIQVGDMLPCYDCHNPHGSEGNNRVEPNAFLLSDQRRDWSGLTDTLNDPQQSRRFCLGCHIASDGIPGSETVEGIVMNTLPDLPAHLSTALESCHDCHGRDYSTAQSYNVHNPSGGGVVDPWGETW